MQIVKRAGNGILVIAALLALLGLAYGSQGCATTGAAGSVSIGSDAAGCRLTGQLPTSVLAPVKGSARCTVRGPFGLLYGIQLDGQARLIAEAPSSSPPAPDPE